MPTKKKKKIRLSNPSDDPILDKFFAMVGIEKIALGIGQNKKEVISRIHDYADNRNKIAEHYRPRIRSSRADREFNQREKWFRKQHRKLGIPPEITARILRRDPRELGNDADLLLRYDRLKDYAPEIDVLLALRYLYWELGNPIVEDRIYDRMKSEAIEYSGAGPALAEWEDKCPPIQRQLALFFLAKFHANQSRELPWNRKGGI